MTLILLQLFLCVSITRMAYSFTAVSLSCNVAGVSNQVNCRKSLIFGNQFNPHHRKNYAAAKSPMYMGMKINIRIVGRKSSEPWLEEGVEMYEKRLRPSNVEVGTTWHKDNNALMKGIDVDRSKNHKVICLDPTGKQQTSENFAEDVYRWLDEGGSRLSFVIGGAEGLPAELKYPSYVSGEKKSKKKTNNDSPILISLSLLTYTHQFARLLLIEQIYRATEIKKGSGYHK
mmetsp:Transcript_27989/g.65805  ORF Transcript_27989/g.65805 Transcript_27989/m.65805 type:complete len:230 (+) Transcript_27989:24-713(+)